jgi:hypothetical protein
MHRGTRSRRELLRVEAVLDVPIAYYDYFLPVVVIIVGRGVGVGSWIEEICGLDNFGFWFEDFCLGSTHEFHLQ